MPRPTSLPKPVRCCLAFATALLGLTLCLLASHYAALATFAIIAGLSLLGLSCLILLACWLRMIYLHWSQQKPAHTSSWFWLN